MVTNSQSTVDVIIPFHRLDNYLIAAINSIKSSRNVRIRLIAINDTGHHIDRAKLNLSNSDLLIETSDHGYINALKVGVAASTENYVAFLDSDDLVHPDKLSKQMEVLNKQNLDFVSCGIQKMNSKNQLSAFGSVLGRVPKSNNSKELWVIGSHGADSTLLCRGETLRESWFTHQNFQAHFADYGWALSLPPEIRIGHLEDKFYFYRSHPRQISKSPNLGDSWKTIYPLWVKNLEAQFPDFVKNRKLSERESLAIAFPASMLRLSRLEIRNLIKFKKTLLSNLHGRSSYEIFTWRKTLARRILIASRGKALRYWYVAPGIIWSIIGLRLLGFGFRKIRS
jgi:glycosyltransferase involved in cell wall biosynthesis